MEFYIRQCDLILVLLPHEFDITSYVEPLRALFRYGGEELLRKRTVFAITRLGRIIPGLPEPRKLHLRRYLQEYVFRLNQTVFEGIPYEVHLEELDTGGVILSRFFGWLGSVAKRAASLKLMGLLGL